MLWTHHSGWFGSWVTSHFCRDKDLSISNSFTRGGKMEKDFKRRYKEQFSEILIVVSWMNWCLLAADGGMNAICLLGRFWHYIIRKFILYIDVKNLTYFYFYSWEKIADQLFAYLHLSRNIFFNFSARWRCKQYESKNSSKTE